LAWAYQKYQADPHTSMAAIILIFLFTLQESSDLRRGAPFDLNVAKSSMTEIFRSRLSKSLEGNLLVAGLAENDIDTIVFNAADQSAQCVLDAWLTYPDDDTQSFLRMIGDPAMTEQLVEQLKRPAGTSVDVGDSTDRLRDIRVIQAEMTRTCFASVAQELGLPIDLFDVF
jgi:hypothetical protein